MRQRRGETLILTYLRPMDLQSTAILPNRGRQHVAGPAWPKETEYAVRGLQPVTPLHWAGEANFWTILCWLVSCSHEMTSKLTVDVGVVSVTVGVELIVHCVREALVKGNRAYRDKQHTTQVIHIFQPFR